MNIPKEALVAAMRVASRNAMIGDDPEDYRAVEELVLWELEAAYPHIAAQVLRAAAEDCNCGDDADLLDNKADALGHE